MNWKWAFGVSLIAATSIAWLAIGFSQSAGRGIEIVVVLVTLGLLAPIYDRCRGDKRGV